MKSKTQIETQLKRKTNPLLVETVILAKKNSAWIEVASLLTGNNKTRKNANLSEIDKLKGNIVAVAGKVLSQGEISKKIKVAALGFSEKAKEKLLKAGCEIILLKDEIQKNKDGKGVTIFK